jgi:hypothetical protein
MLWMISWGWVDTRRHTHVCQYSCMGMFLCVVRRCCIVSLEPWLPLVYCQKQSHPPHTPFSTPKTYMCICASLWLKNKPISSQTRPTYACTCVHILTCFCIRLLTATVLDKCLNVCRAARLQDKMHSIICQCVRVQYSSDTYWEIWIVCVCECVWGLIWEREEERAFRLKKRV